jgi:hypothetical protein
MQDYRVGLKTQTVNGTLASAKKREQCPETNTVL